MSDKIEKLNEQNLLDNLGKIAYTLDKTYIEELSSDKYFCLPYSDTFNNGISYDENIRACRVLRWVYNKEEKPGEALKNVLGTFSDGENTIALVINRKPDSVEIYFVVKNSIPGGNEISKDNGDLLRKSLMGNFQGSNISEIYAPSATEKLFDFNSFKSVSVLSNMPSKYAENYVTQGLDKIIESVIPENDDDSYSIVFLADSLSLSNIRETLSGYEELATAIQPYIEYQYSKGKNETNTETESTSIAKNESISNSVFKTHSINIGTNHSVSNTLTKGISLFVKFIGASLSKSKTTTNGISAGYGYSWGKSKTITYGTTNTKGMSSSISLGNSETSTYTYKSFLVKNIQEKLEFMMDRINKSQSNGLWKYAVYVFAKQPSTSKNIASLIKATTQGKESYITPALIQEWSIKENNEEHDDFKEIRNYVTNFIHPIFCSTGYEFKNGQILRAENNMLVTATSLVSTDELSQVIVIPKKSMDDLPVVQGIDFGREPHGIKKIETDFCIGNAYHMYEENPKKKIALSKQELKSHLFITGSTGSGKSNTIYQILYELQKDKNTKFLVIEPAKGEYKNIFCTGEKPIANLYGTNPDKAPLLRINPFSFHGDTHILEHLDRLIEIFNVCWPMYAAMPAILKEAVEKSYEDVGWDLLKSINRYNCNYFPTFSDVARNIKNIIDSSEYDSDNKGAYKGSLLTRLNSLCNGINGLIFSKDEISEDTLFEQNTVIDLSRIGSNETKSLIMGLLVLKLQEFRMSQASDGTIVPNSELRHVTVLEEAHNLLKKASPNQGGESANLAGKSVEMITNSIAEMRTYGESFIIADQAPGLLDAAVIRNTNTKIIMRLPDQTDRELVGKSANLTEDQIMELARLDTGVAAIYQNKWIQPVLCKIRQTDELKYNQIYKFSKEDNREENLLISKENAVKITKLLLNNDKSTINLDDLRNMNLSDYSKVIISDLYNGLIDSPSFVITGIVISEIYKNATISLKKVVTNSTDYSLWTNTVYRVLDKDYKDYFDNENIKKDVCQAIFTEVILNEMNKINILKEWSQGGYLG